MSKVSYEYLLIMETMYFFERKWLIFKDDGEMGTNHINCKKMAGTISEQGHLVLTFEYDVVT